MVQYIPIILSGNSLGERHRQLNSSVNEAYKSTIPFISIRDVPESSPVCLHRLFKIDLASKHKDVDYIVQNLKDTDMLYVSRALKCTWLLDPQYSHIINPNYLEDTLFPEMITPAVNKMKHWIHHQLQDPQRCRIFYEGYKKSEFQLAMKFLRNCCNEYLLEEFENIMTSIKPKQLKVLSEKCPQLTKTFYERIKHDNDLLKHYLGHEKEFLRNLKYLLKPDPDTFFNILQKYYNVQRNRSFRSDITHHIMVHHKDKFFKKPELYTVHLLDKNTLAKCLSPEEAKDLVVKLAHAAYLENWFTYKTAEPLILRLDKNARVALKKMIFVNKEIGVKIKDWPYDLPTSPVLEKKPGYSLFLDKVHDPRDYNTYNKCVPLACCGLKLENGPFKQKTLLNDLFDHYRFASFESTFFELQTRLRSESSPQNRQYMMLVLVSKCGGRENSLRTLFGLLAQYKNEPVHLRAAIVRSLVKRAFAWRLPEDLWSNLLDWAHGLGLDGSQSEVACNEGLHAVVLRAVLASETPHLSVLNAFFNLFTNFAEYSLTTAERWCVWNSLPNILMAAAEKTNGDEKLKRFKQVLETLQAYEVSFSIFPSIITTIATAAQEDPEKYEYILKCLFDARAGRKQLFKVNFSRIQNNASYMNALRHDITVLDAKKFKDLHAFDKRTNFYKPRLQFSTFLQKVIIYFSEDGGLAKEFYSVLKLEAERKPHKLLARPLALLAGNDLPTLLKTFDSDTKRRPKTAKQILSAALRANGHVSRPPIDLIAIGWDAAGVKAVTNVVSISPKKKRDELVAKLIKWKRALRLALALSVNNCTKHTVFKTFIELRPGAALKAFLRWLKCEKLGDCFFAIWNDFKPLIAKLDYKNRSRLFNNLDNTSIPKAIRHEYYVLVHKVYMNKDERKALPILCRIENICSEVDETFLYEAMKTFLENDFTSENILDDYFKYDIYKSVKFSLYIRIIAKFLLLCNSKEIQKKRLEIVGEPFFSRFESIWNHSASRKHLGKFLVEFLTALKYNRVIFDDKYISCMPVFERVVSWMQSMLTVEKWIDVYVNIHLTMLYHKAARHCIKQKPEYFEADSTNLDKGVKMFGAVFGKLVAHEFEELKSKYFLSIKEIYQKELIDYFVSSIYVQNYDESKEKFAIAFVKSILVESKTKEAHFIAFHVFLKHVKRYFRYEYDLSDIMNLLKDTHNNEIKFNFEMMMTDDSKRCNKIKIYLDATTA